MKPTTIRKRDGKIDRFKPAKMRDAISKAARATHIPDAERVVDDVYSTVMQRLGENGNGIVSIADVEKKIIDTARERGYVPLANAYESYRDRRTNARRLLAVMTSQGQTNTTDAALLIESDSKEVVGIWDRKRITAQLEEEAGLAHDFATDIAKNAENTIIDLYERGVRRLNTTDVRAIVDLFLKQEGLEAQRNKQALLGMPTSDLEAIIFSKSAENSNIGSHNPEAVNLEIAERIQKQWSLKNVFSSDVSEAHLKGVIHLHDLGYPTRVYCSSHSIEYIKKFGLNKLLANLEAKSNSPNSTETLNQHVQTFLASMQAHYAGALGFGYLNIFYAPLLNRPVEVVEGVLGGVKTKLEKRDLEKMVEQGVITLDSNVKGKPFFEKISEKIELMDRPYKDYRQTAQNLIFAASQNAFSRGGQTLFIDFNIHTGIPKYMQNVPAVGPGGKYMVQMPNGEVRTVTEVPRFKNSEDEKDSRNGDADDSKLEGELKGGRILTYGFFKDSSQKFTKAMLEIWRKGDKDGRWFRFPKCDLHVDDNSFKNPDEEALVDLASEVAAENGCIYFMYDRGDDAVLAQCCRLKEKITDTDMLKHPERLRFCGFQNVTVNLAQAAYRGKTLEGTLEEIGNSMEIAAKAHEQKRNWMQRLLDTPGSPMHSLGVPSDDGRQYIDLSKATYLVGIIGLNEAVQVVTSEQIHESENALKTGLIMIAYMNKKANELKERTGMKITLEESPAESTTRRMAKVDLQHFEKAKGIVKGTKENPYYTNSIHFAPDADVGLVDRIVGQSKFHDMITSGAIVHAWVGEKRPEPSFVKETVKNTLYGTRCSQLTFSPTYTECDSCGSKMPGDVAKCKNKDCKDPTNVHPVTKIVGYNSRIDHWNGSQIQIYLDRKKAEDLYAGGKGRDMAWLYNPNGHEKVRIIQFGKEGCVSCENVEENTRKVISKLGLDGKVDFVVHHLNKYPVEGLAEAALYDIPLETVPSIVIAGKNNHWKKTTRYSQVKGERSDLIGPREIAAELTKRAAEYGIAVQ